VAVGSCANNEFLRSAQGDNNSVRLPVPLTDFLDFGKTKATGIRSPLFVGWLLGQDSNLQPTGYISPRVSARNGLSHHPRGVRGARGQLIGQDPHCL